MSKILLIDDLRHFKDDTDAVICRTSRAAIEYLEANPDETFSEVWFDHDLGLVPETGKEDDTMIVVDHFNYQAMIGNPVQVANIYVHTSNPPGAKKIYDGLTRYGYKARKVDAAEFFFVPDHT
jgi:hypothetical protein